VYINFLPPETSAVMDTSSSGNKRGDRINKIGYSRYNEVTSNRDMLCKET